MSDDIGRELVEELERQGAADIVVDRKHRHPRIHFTYRKRRQYVVFPGTPSDRRGRLNAIATLRRVLRAPARQRSKGHRS